MNVNAANYDQKHFDILELVRNCRSLYWKVKKK